MKTRQELAESLKTCETFTAAARAALDDFDAAQARERLLDSLKEKAQELAAREKRDAAEHAAQAREHLLASLKEKIQEAFRRYGFTADMVQFFGDDTRMQVTIQCHAAEHYTCALRSAIAFDAGGCVGNTLSNKL
jgi:hypothetical protein